MGDKVPVDAFWSISVYNAERLLRENMLSTPIRLNDHHGQEECRLGR